MRTRALALTILLSLAALLSACAGMPSILAPTAEPPTAAPVATAAGGPATEVAVSPSATVLASTSPLATPAIEPPAAITPTVSAAITPTLAITATTVAAANAGTPVAAVTAPAAAQPSNAAPAQVAPSGPMITYTDPVAGFAIDYPAPWSVVDVAPETRQQATNYSITFMSWKPQEPGSQGIPQGGSKIDLSVNKGTATTLDAAVESRRQELAAEGAGSQITFEEPWDLPGGLTGTHWTIQPASGEPSQEFITAINGNRILLSGLGDASLFEQIAMTLRAVEANRGATATGATAAPSATPGAQAQEKVAVPMVASGAAGKPAEGQGAVSTTYAVRQGDTLAKIAARFGVTMAAILKANPQIKNPDHIVIGQRIIIPGSGSTQPPPAGTTRVNIFMIGMGGGSVGCGDQVVAIQRDVPATGAPLTAALNLLLSQKSQYYGESGLYNPLYQSNLSIASITRVGTSWTVRLTGTLRLGGVCDNPRVKAQLEQTALQFSTVKSVRYFVNGKSLDTVLSGK